MTISRTPSELTENAQLEQRLERLRRGTLDRFESEWFFLSYDAASSKNTARTLRHDLQRLPATVDVQRSDRGDGGLPKNGNADVTVVKTDSTITVTSTLSRGAFFRVVAY